MEAKRKSAANIFVEQQASDEDNFVSEPAMEEIQEPLRMDRIAAPAAAPTPKGKAPNMQLLSQIKSSEELQLEKEPVRLRETGRWFWRKIIVPPNAYVVHTRFNQKEPITIGMGLSFRYNPFKDSYLVIPGAMQTIGVVATCITKEKQGINILAYVQWQIEDFSIAYRKLDFSDSRDPLGIVNAQLREQAEAAIKDKIATMSVEEVLTDKEPVIEELTARLKLVTEGRQKGDQTAQEGLGIKIVTVQIREAIVSSASLWENLQKPFRYEKEKSARISYLNTQREIHEKELETKLVNEQGRTQTEFEIARLRQSKETETHELRLRQESIRFSREQEDQRQRLEQQEQSELAGMESRERIRIRENQFHIDEEKRRINQDFQSQINTLQEETRMKEIQLELEGQLLRQRLELEKLRAQVAQLEQQNLDQMEAMRLEARLHRTEQENQADLAWQSRQQEQEFISQKNAAHIEELRQQIKNRIGENDILAQLVARLPEIAQAMPEIKDLRIVQTGAQPDFAESLISFVTKILAMAKGVDFGRENPSAD